MSENQALILHCYVLLSKHIGSRCDYIDERDTFLLAKCKEYDSMCFAEGRNISMRDRMAYAVSQPAPRFWVSESRAKDIVSEMKRGRWKGKKVTTRERLARCLYERYVELRKLKPKESILSLMMDIVNSPAPESFLCPQSAVVILCRHKKKIREGRKLDVSPSKLPRKLTPAYIKPKEEEENEEPIADTRIDDDTASDDDPARVRPAVGVVKAEPGGNPARKADIQLPACRVAALACEPVLPADCMFPHARKSVAVLDSLGNRIDYASRTNRRHTNIRYIRSQLCLGWNNDGGQ